MEKLDKNEMLIEIPFSKYLAECGSKNLKFKVMTDKHEEILKHYFDIRKQQGQDISKVFIFDKDVQ